MVDCISLAESDWWGFYEFVIYWLRNTGVYHVVESHDALVFGLFEAIRIRIIGATTIAACGSNCSTGVHSNISDGSYPEPTHAL